MENFEKENEMMIIEKGFKYSFEDISKYEQMSDFEMFKYGNNVIGEELIVLSPYDEDIKISFVLISITSNMYYYECVYTDILSLNP